MFILCILLLIAAVVLFIVGRARSSGSDSGSRPWTLGAALSAVAAVLAGLFACVHVIDAYQVGVPVTFGTVGKPMKSGIHFTSPFTSITSLSTRPVDLDLNDKDTVEVRTSEGGVLYADVTVKWAVDPAKAIRLYQLAGTADGVQERLVRPDCREIIRNVFAKHTSEEGYASGREQIGQEIGSLVKERLAPRGIDVTAVNLRNVKPSKELQEQIDKKIQQQQATQKAQEEVLTAKAEAERKRIDAQSAAETKRIDAEATAKANEIVSRSLSDKILYNQCLDAFKEAAQSNPVYAVPCGTGKNETPVIVDGTKN